MSSRIMIVLLFCKFGSQKSVWDASEERAKSKCSQHKESVHQGNEANEAKDACCEDKKAEDGLWLIVRTGSCGESSPSSLTKKA
jgi:hypothetical protein